MEEEKVKDKKVNGFVAHSSGLKSWIESIKSFFQKPSSRMYALLGVVLITIITLTVSAILPSFNTTNQQHANVASCVDECDARCTNNNTTCQQNCNTTARNCTMTCAGHRIQDNTTCTNTYNTCVSQCNQVRSTLLRQECSSGCSDTLNTCNINTDAKYQSCNATCNSNQYSCQGSCNNTNHNCQVNCALFTCKATPTPTSPPAGGKCSGGTCTSSGACKANDGTVSNISGCTGGYICCLAPTPTPKISPAPTPNPTSCKNAGGVCTPSGSCTANGGVVQQINPSCTQSGYPAGYLCCKQAPPTPTLAPKCSQIGGICIENNSLSINNPPQHVCLDGITQTQDCQSQGEFCCTGAYATPTPPQLPPGNPCVGTNPSNGQIEKGVCFYTTQTSPYYSSSTKDVCNWTMDGYCPDKLPSCSTMAPGTHFISDNLKGCGFSFQYINQVACCAEQQDEKTQFMNQLIKGGLSTCINNSSDVGICLLRNITVPIFGWTVAKFENSTTEVTLSNISTKTSVKFHITNSDKRSCPSGIGTFNYDCYIPETVSSFNPNNCTTNGGVCSHGGLPAPDPKHTFNNAQYSCSSGTVCWTTCPANTSCAQQAQTSCSGTCAPSNANLSGKHVDDSQSCSTSGDVCWVNNCTGSTCSTCTGPNCSSSGPTCTNGQATSFSLSVKLPGIGQGNFENHGPKHTNRHVKLEVIDLNNNKTVKITPRNGTYSLSNDGTLTFSNVNLGTTLGCGGKYKVAVSIPGSLRILSDQELTYGKDTSTNNLTAAPLPGDIVNPSAGYIVDTSASSIGDNKIDINDYNIMAQCHNADPNADQTITFFNKTIHFTCGNVVNFFDYPDGGTNSDEWAANYNIMLRSWIQSNGNGQ